MDYTRYAVQDQTDTGPKVVQKALIRVTLNQELGHPMVYCIYTQVLTTFGQVLELVWTTAW